jgi:excisionase family DNA binding protein
MQSHAVERIALRIPEVAAMLGLSKSAAYRLVRSRELRAVRIGGSVRVLRIDFDAYLERHRCSDGSHEPPR